MSYGFGTWDVNGVYNNTGLVPVNVLGFYDLPADATGSYSFPKLPSGMTLGFIAVPSSGSLTPLPNGRRIYVNGSNIIVEKVDNSNYGVDRYPNTPLFIVGYAK